MKVYSLDHQNQFIINISKSIILFITIFFIYLFIFLTENTKGINIDKESWRSNKSQQTMTPSVVGLKGRKLIVNGKPFIMRGICYNPIQKGQTNQDGPIFINPNDQDLQTIDHDFTLMEDAGINTIRTYEPITDRAVLDLLNKHHLYTIIPLLSSYAKEEEVTSIIAKLKKEPSTLIWEIGNEWNYNHFYSQNKASDSSSSSNDDHTSENIKDSPPHSSGYIGWKECIKIVTKTVTTVRDLDDHSHPISTCIGELPQDAGEKNDLGILDVDFYGVNVYDFLELQDHILQWSQFSSKPIYISEFGCDAYNMNLNSGFGAEDDYSQADAINQLLKQIGDNLSGKEEGLMNVIGGCLFEFCDEWWKDPTEDPSTHSTGGIQLKVKNQRGELVPLGGPYPDRFFNEEWFGITDIDRNPRAAYQIVKKYFKDDPQSPFKDNAQEQNSF